jgi:hypothetical protein
VDYGHNKKGGSRVKDRTFLGAEKKGFEAKDRIKIPAHYLSKSKENVRQHKEEEELPQANTFFVKDLKDLGADLGKNERRNEMGVRYFWRRI